MEKYTNLQNKPLPVDAPSHYELLPDAILGSTETKKTFKESFGSTSGFDDDFVAVFDNAATTSEINVKQNKKGQNLKNGKYFGFLIVYILKVFIFI
jgi:hypothetical protein